MELFRQQEECSRDNLTRIKDGAYIINLDDKQYKGTRWVSLFIDRNTAVYFDSFGSEYILKNVLNKIKNKSIAHYIFRIQSDGFLMCGVYCIAFIKYIVLRKTSLDYIILLMTIKNWLDNI